MDQDAFRDTYREVNERFCAFERAILTNQCKCPLAERFCIAEREGVHCTSDSAQARCLELQEQLRSHARFALKERDAGSDQPGLPYGKAMRIQVGGLRGLHAVLAPGKEPPDVVSDVNGIIAKAVETYGELSSLPFSDIMPHIAAYRGRVRSRRRR